MNVGGKECELGRSREQLEGAGHRVGALRYPSEEWEERLKCGQSQGLASAWRAVLAACGEFDRVLVGEGDGSASVPALLHLLNHPWPPHTLQRVHRGEVWISRAAEGRTGESTCSQG